MALKLNINANGHIFSLFSGLKSCPLKFRKSEKCLTGKTLKSGGVKFFMAKRSFFADLRFLDTELKRLRLSERCEDVFRNLVAFIESASFTTSGSFKFICQNWRLGYTELCDRWIASGNEEKSSTTFRVQTSNLSSILYCMFPDFSREVFLDDQDSEPELVRIELTISALESSSRYGSQTLFIAEVSNYLDSYDYTGQLTIADCVETIRKLKLLTKSEVYRFMDELDMNQLKFVLEVMSRPLFGVRGRTCDKDKVDLLREFESCDASLLTATTASLEVPKQKVVEKPVYVETPERTPYTLGITKAVADALTSKAEAKITTQESEEYTRMTQVEKDKRKRYIYKILRSFTPDGILNQLARFNPIEVAEVLDGDYPLEEGEEVFPFKR